ncbi:MAG: tetraacyldisaccharide 4'-kinase [Bacteriovoracaceae bacterium]|jgi:tetraacyldisaccharide 4'-kinase|nr:tetraacyldisaccharide 4'-kinase [Bacteriovoracaceae bacterium]
MFNRFLSKMIFLLIPFSLIWDAIHRIRRHFYFYGVFRQNHFEVPIISIGNLSFGGTGKTPFTLWMSKYLDEIGMKVMILTRGYKGNLEHSSGIIRSGRKLGFNSKEYGDEATLLARRQKSVTVVVGKNRSSNLEYYFEEVNPDIVLLDDGHQHLHLSRNLNIVLFDVTMPLDKYKVAPLGYLRENFSALRDTDVVIFGKVNQVDETVIKDLEDMIKPYVSKDTLFSKMYYRPTGFFDVSYQKKFNLEELENKNIIAVAGIASPHSFFELLTNLNLNVMDTFTYPDHHYFTLEEMSEILDTAKRHDAYVITTEKDMVKMRQIVDDDSMLYLEILIDFISGEEDIKNIISGVFSSEKKI